MPRRRDIDSVQLMSAVYELARAVEDVTGLEGYDPQVGEPVSAQLDEDVPTRRRWPDDPADDDSDEEPVRRGSPAAARRTDLAPDPAASGESAPRRWWQVWKA